MPGGPAVDALRGGAQEKWIAGSVPAAAAAAVAVHDVLQRRHTVLRKFPVIGHARYWLEAPGPGLRQYIVASNSVEGTALIQVRVDS